MDGLFNLKAQNGWIERSFNELLEFLKEMILEGGKDTMFDGFEYKKIIASPNDCVVYKDEFVALRVSLTCGLSQLKKNLMELVVRKNQRVPC